MSGLGKASIGKNVENAARVERITRCVVAYQGPLAASDSDQEAVCDILSDLQHFCLSEDVDFDGCLAMARQHFEAER